MTHQPLSHSRGGLISSLAGWLLLAASGIAAAQGNSPTQLRGFIDQQVGGIQKMMVPAHNTELPQPRLANGSPDPQFQTTEANCCFTNRRERPGLSRNSVASPNTAEVRPAEPVISARRHRSPARSSTSPRVARGEATRTPKGTSLRAGGPGRTCRSCGRPLSSRATRWWTICPR